MEAREPLAFPYGLEPACPALSCGRCAAVRQHLSSPPVPVADRGVTFQAIEFSEHRCANDEYWALGHQDRAPIHLLEVLAFNEDVGVAEAPELTPVY